MSLSADALYRMSDVDLLTAYAEARRQFVDKKFTRDTQRARLAWIRAKMFVGGSGGVTERNMAIDVSEEIARKGQELREMTRDQVLFTLRCLNRRKRWATLGLRPWNAQSYAQFPLGL